MNSAEQFAFRATLSDGRDLLLLGGADPLALSGIQPPLSCDGPTCEGAGARRGGCGARRTHGNRHGAKEVRRVSMKARAWSVAMAALLLVPSADAAPPEVFGYFRNSDLDGVLLPRDETTAATGPLADSVSVPWTPSEMLFASYETDYGLIHLLADHEWPAQDPAGFASAGPTAGWRDRITVTAPGVTGIGSLELRFRVTGLVQSAVSGAQACSLVNVSTLEGSLRQRSTCSFHGGAPTGDGFGDFDYGPFLVFFGSPFEISVEAFADAGSVPTTAGFARTESTVEYLGVVAVRDGSEQPVATYAIAADSGFDYAVPVPEPGPLAGGLAALVVLAASFASRLPSGQRSRSRRSPRQ